MTSSYHKIKSRWAAASDRSKLATKNIAAGIVLKSLSILVSLLIVPLTIGYLNPDQYGIWLALSSIVAWANFMDLGLANGFRNRFTEAKAKGNLKLAREYVSTTYILLGGLMAIVVIVAYIINLFIDWATVLGVSQSYKAELQHVFAILIAVFCTTMIANIIEKLLSGDQHPAIASLIAGIGQIFSLIAIFLLNRYTAGNMVTLALCFSSIPCLTLIVASIILFKFTRYRIYRPSFNLFRKGLIRNIMGLGVRFFLIYLCLIAIFQMINVVLSREAGPMAVTQYNIAFKYFTVIYMVSYLIMTPMWSAYSDAYARNDFEWMRATMRKLELLICLSFFIFIGMILLSGFAYHIWVGNEVSIPLSMSIAVAIYIFSQTFAGVYLQIISGLGRMKIQFLIYFIFALVAFPCMTFFCRTYGAEAIVIIPTLTYLAQGIIIRKQIYKIINQTASGIWLQ